MTYRINTERTKRHMRKSTPDTLTLPAPFSFAQEEANRIKFWAWIKNWGILHDTEEPYVISTRWPDGSMHYRASIN